MSTHQTAPGLTTCGKTVAAQGDPQPQLFVVLDRANLLAGGSRHSLSNIDRVEIGRGSERGAQRRNDSGRAVLTLTLTDARVSFQHARIERDGESWMLMDQGSTNGSSINGARVKTAPLVDGDIIEVGRTLLRFRAALPSPTTAAGDVGRDELEGVVAVVGTLQPLFTRELQRLRLVARSELSVLIMGESGSGKEVLARAVHSNSGRGGSFVAVNCGALPAGLVESLLFGHTKGAFSGAAQSEPGFVRMSHGGTLFLDEVGDLPLASQATLLRVLQEREVVPVGATRPVPTDVRVVAATHLPLDELVRQARFRQDLYARLSAFTFVTPPLRDRIEDLGNLLALILPKIAKDRASGLSIDRDAALTMINHPWPLNVRELEQSLAAAVLLANGSRLDATAAGRPLRAEATSAPAEAVRPAAVTKRPASRRAKLSAQDAALREELLSLLREHHGNVTHVAKAMAKARTQVQRWLRRFGIDVTQVRAD